MTAEKYIALLPTEWRVINHYGVDIDLRVLDSTELGPLRKKRSPHHRQQGKWPFHVDPYNPMTVLLNSPTSSSLPGVRPSRSSSLR